MAKALKKNPIVAKKAAQKQMRFTQLSRLYRAMAHEFTLQSLFKYGYRNKEDISNLPASTLVVGSQNVLTNAAEIVAVRNGIQYDGSAGSQNTYGVDSSYDFDTGSLGGVQNTRKWGTNLEVRYVNPVTKVVSWINILSTLIATNVMNATKFWNGTQNLMLFVNGAAAVNSWTGAVASYLSSTSNTLTVSGSATLTKLNFASSGALTINGTQYSYTSAGLNGVTVYSQTPTNTKVPLTSLAFQRISQKFTTNAAATQITTATISLNALASQTFVPYFTAQIYTDNAGVPGTLVGPATNAGAVGAITGAADFAAAFNFQNIFVAGNTNYHLVITAGGTQGNNISIYTGNTGSVGTNQSLDGGNTWSAINGYMNATITENETNTTTFLGVSPDPTGAGIAVGDAIIQTPVTGVGLAIGVATPYVYDLIEAQYNEVYFGCFASNTVNMSKVSSYTDCSFSTPRIVGEGQSGNLSSPPTAFIIQDNTLYISAGKNSWFKVTRTLSSDNSKESVTFDPIKTTFNQGAQSQGLVGKFKNSIIYVSYEPIFNSFGPVKNILSEPQIVNLSDPIKFDFDAYDFTGGHVVYDNYYIYVSVPRQGVVRMYNVQKKYWEAPQTMTISRFYHVNGLLYGHSLLTNESYQLFVPGSYNDIGNPINAVAAFPYVCQQGGQAPQKKFFNKFYTEGYISTNANLTMTVNYDFGGFSGNYSTALFGTNPHIIFNKITDGSLGRNNLGDEPIGQILNLSQQPANPKFRSINTFPPVHNFEYQIVYSSNEVDYYWSLLRFGPAIGPASALPVEITA